MLERCLSDRHCASLADCVAILTDAGHLPPRNTCRPQSAVVGICSWLGLGFRIRVSVIRVTIRNITFSVLRTEFMLGLRLWLGFRTRSYG